MKTILALLLVFPAVVHSAPPILFDLKTGKLLNNTSANQHDQNSVNNPSVQHGNQHLQGSVIKRNNPGGKSHERGKRDKSVSNVTDPHKEIVGVPLFSW